MSYDDDAESAPDLVFDLPTLRPPKEKGGMWELVNDWSVFYKGSVYHIPAGFKTDGASIPRFLWRVCGTPLDVPRVYAAIVHDWLYTGGIPNAARLHDALYTGLPLVTRAEADALYRDLLIALGVSRFKACIEWGALRLCGGSHWYENTNKKRRYKMNKLIMIVAVAAFAGCTSLEVKKHPQTLATYTDTNGVIRVVCDNDGKPIILEGGWAIDYLKHWMWTKLDTFTGTAGPGVAVSINGYESGVDSNLVALVKTSFDGAALLAAKVGAAIATAGGSAGVEGVASMVRQFVSKGGDVSKATVNCANGACTISDGTVSETCTSCFDK